MMLAYTQNVATSHQVRLSNLNLTGASKLYADVENAQYSAGCHIEAILLIRQRTELLSILSYYK